MSDTTKIEWTDSSWTPIRARNRETGKVGWFCEHVSHGCDNCYAEKMNVNTYFGNGLPYKASSLPQLELFLDEKILEQPLHWRKSRKVFVCSMTDLFARFVPDEWIDRIFAVMALSPMHMFQLLTKRAERMREYMAHPATEGRVLKATTFPLGKQTYERCNRPMRWPLPNCWLGVSVENQETTDERIPLLLQTPAATRFISAEPLLSAIDLDRFLDPTGFQCIDPDCLHRYLPFVNEDDYETTPSNDPICRDCGEVGTWTGYESGLDWVIVGGESGPRSRPCDISNIRAIVEQCKAAGVKCFVKQLGSKPFMGVKGFGPAIRDRKGGDINEFPEDLRVREFPTPL